jgi:predicted DNA-binding transcriptional regulator AlpA
MDTQHSKYVSIPQLAQMRQLKVSWLYERSRRNKLPGQCRYGRLIRINIEQFDAGVSEGVLA